MQYFFQLLLSHFLPKSSKPNEILIDKLPSAHQQSPLVSMATPVRLPVTSTNKLNARKSASPYRSNQDVFKVGIMCSRCCSVDEIMRMMKMLARW